MKLTLAPGLVAVTTLAGRRFGALVAGVVGGFPAGGGPILIALHAPPRDHFPTRGPRRPARRPLRARRRRRRPGGPDLAQCLPRRLRVAGPQRAVAGGPRR